MKYKSRAYYENITKTLINRDVRKNTHYNNKFHKRYFFHAYFLFVGVNDSKIYLKKRFLNYLCISTMCVNKITHTLQYMA